MADQKINGALYRSMVIEAHSPLRKKERANELNVFPVPDGDTGTNICHDDGVPQWLRWKSSPSRASPKQRMRPLLRCCAAARQLGCYPVAAVPRHGEKAAQGTGQGRRPHSRACAARGVDTATKAVMKPLRHHPDRIARLRHSTRSSNVRPSRRSPQSRFWRRSSSGPHRMRKPFIRISARKRQAWLAPAASALSPSSRGMLDALRGIHKERAVAAEPTKSTADFAASTIKGHHLHLLHRVHRIPQGQGAQCRSSALHSERDRRLAGGCRG